MTVTKNVENFNCIFPSHIPWKTYHTLEIEADNVRLLFLMPKMFFYKMDLCIFCKPHNFQISTHWNQLSFIELWYFENNLMFLICKIIFMSYTIKVQEFNSSKITVRSWRSTELESRVCSRQRSVLHQSFSKLSRTCTPVQSPVHCTISCCTKYSNIQEKLHKVQCSEQANISCQMWNCKAAFAYF